MEVEDNVCVTVLPWHCVGPQFLHKEHLVCEVRCSTLKRDYKVNGNQSNSLLVNKSRIRVTKNLKMCYFKSNYGILGIFLCIYIVTYFYLMCNLLLLRDTGDQVFNFFLNIFILFFSNMMGEDMMQLRNTNIIQGKLTISGWPCLFDPVCEVPHKVKEEVSFGNRDDLISNLDKE